jgi:hypothetical protein
MYHMMHVYVFHGDIHYPMQMSSPSRTVNLEENKSLSHSSQEKHIYP